MKNFLFFLIVLLLVFTPLFANESYTYETLKDSLSLNNTTLLNSIEVYNQAKLDTKDAKAGYHPKVDLTLTGTYIFNPLDPITISASELGLPTNQYVTIYDGMESTYYNASLSLTQPLFTWGKLTNSVRLFKEVETARALQVEDTGNQLEAELKTRLASLYYLDQIMMTLKEQQGYARDLVRLAEDAYKQGTMLELDYKMAEIDALQVDVALSQIKAQYDSLLTYVETMTGAYDISEAGFYFIPDEAYFYQIAAADRAKLIAMATSQSRPALQALSSAEKAREYQQKIAKNSVYWKPDIALQLSASYGGSRLPLFQTDWTRQDAWNGMVTLAIKTTLWDGGVKLNDIKRAESGVKSATIDKADALNTIRTTMTDQFATMDVSIAQIKYLELKEETDEANIDIIKTKMKYGASSNTELLQAQIERCTTKLNLLEQKLQLAQAAYTIEYLTALKPSDLN